MVIQETTPTSSSHKDNIVKLVKAWLTSAGTITVNQYNIAMSLPQKLHLKDETWWQDNPGGGSSPCHHRQDSPGGGSSLCLKVKIPCLRRVLERSSKNATAQDPQWSKDQGQESWWQDRSGEGSSLCHQRQDRSGEGSSLCRIRYQLATSTWVRAPPIKGVELQDHQGWHHCLYKITKDLNMACAPHSNSSNSPS